MVITCLNIPIDDDIVACCLIMCGFHQLIGFFSSLNTFSPKPMRFTSKVFPKEQTWKKKKKKTHRFSSQKYYALIKSTELFLEENNFYKVFHY